MRLPLPPVLEDTRMRKLSCYFAMGSGLVQHVVRHTHLLGDVRLFACGKPMPYWWEPKGRHRVHPEKIVACECGRCASYVRKVIEEANRRGRRIAGRKPGRPKKATPADQA